MVGVYAKSTDQSSDEALVTGDTVHMSIDGLEVLPTVLARRRGDRVAGWVCPLLVLSRRADQLQKGVLVRAEQMYFART